jgi:hypothetical protein
MAAMHPKDAIKPALQIHSEPVESPGLRFSMNPASGNRTGTDGRVIKA